MGANRAGGKNVLQRIVSGGQTGVDRGALDAAIAAQVPHGGWCPAGRLAEDGTIPNRYKLAEVKSSDYAVRTERNVTDSDATLILCQGKLSGGTELTYLLAQRHEKPCLVVDLCSSPQPADARAWIDEYRVEVLNVAGPRESTSPGIGQAAKEFVQRLLGDAQASQ